MEEKNVNFEELGRIIDDQIAHAVAVKGGHAASAHAELAAGLGACGNFHVHRLLVEAGDVDFAA